MHIRRSVALCSALLVCVPAFAGAQDTGKIGITMGYPGSVGLLWHATESVAIRPAITFTSASFDGISGDFSSFGLDLGALFYVKKYDNVRTYLSPRFSYTHTSNSTSTANDLTSNTTGGVGAFGTQFAPSPHFSVYGEVGIGISRRTSETNFVGASLKGTTWGTMAGVGIVFYP